ncbi:XdhC/CoxI family protein [Eubacteriales bacterium OttesenSCG-928-K08]|nr:XdhC/CoxI family protein [Eubacteriales bacterium OttesenSCG-928-K08]
MSKMQLLEKLLLALQQNKACAMATIIDTEGSVSRRHGKMLIYADKTTSGTIGGGVIERAAISDAIHCINETKNGCFHYKNVDECAGEDTACSGSMQVFIETFNARPALYLCGGGHVGTALIPLAQAAGYAVTLVDTRSPEHIPEAVRLADRFVRVDEFEQGIFELMIAPGACFLISTYGHAHDGECLYAALQKQAAYIGMVGSVKKREALFKKLLERGISQSQLNEVYTPAGLDLGGETPGEIAISIMAEILQLVNKRTGAHSKSL